MPHINRRTQRAYREFPLARVSFCELVSQSAKNMLNRDIGNRTMVLVARQRPRFIERRPSYGNRACYEKNIAK